MGPIPRKERPIRNAGPKSLTYITWIPEIVEAKREVNPTLGLPGEMGEFLSVLYETGREEV